MLASTNRPKDDSHYLFTKPTANFQFSIVNCPFAVPLLWVCSFSAHSLLRNRGESRATPDPHQSRARSLHGRNKRPSTIVIKLFWKFSHEKATFFKKNSMPIENQHFTKNSLSSLSSLSKKWVGTHPFFYYIIYIYINIYIIYFV